MKIFSFLVAAILIALASVWMHDHFSKTPSQTAQESAYDRVMRTQTLRCGYADWPPIVFYKNIKSGELAGVSHDITEELGKRLSLKIVWSEDTNWSNIISGLQTKKMDAFCTMFGVTSERGRYVAYSRPVFFTPVFPYVRTDDHRFDDDIMKANSPDVRFSSIDGELSDNIARSHFPLAQINAVPQTLQVSESLNNIATDKSDIIVIDYGFGESYIKNNPNKLRRLGDNPFAVAQVAYGFDIHETMLREMIDNALTEMHNQGIIDQIIAKHSGDPLEILRVAPLYRK
ncbi:MAG: transporter substrate-binding domain-containing protein [Alphaproteobacteria bacterium]|nr:transporter substrate-binding domain-containing protein [Alphaproteobacteria bacterium]